MTQTEYDFTLPVGLLDGDGAWQREGTMRLATARDEIEPLRDARVRENEAYLSVLRLARVVTRLGGSAEVTPQLVEQLYAADFEHLKRMYERVNAAPAPLPTVPAPAAPGAAAATHARPPGLAQISDTALDWLQADDTTSASSNAPDLPIEQAPQTPQTPSLAREPASASSLEQRAWPEGLPIGLRQDRERALSREALIRASAPPRRGQIEEGFAGGGDRALAIARDHDAAPAPAPAPARARARQSRSEQPPPRLMSFSPQPPAAPSDSAASARALSSAAEIEQLCEELIGRLRRELLVERERMGNPLGA